MSKRYVSSGGGTNSLTVLLIVFVVLKLVGLISWSWWWVLSPMWIPIALVLFLFIVYKIFNP